MGSIKFKAMKYFFFFSLLLSSFNLSAQYKHDYTWLIGLEDDGPSYPNNCMNLLRFNNGELTIDRESINTEMFVANASFSDEQGNLLFYSNGCYIKNKNHEIMPNGEHLNPGVIYDDNCPDYGYTSPGGIIILNSPGDKNIYSVFHQAYEAFDESPFIRINRLYFSKIDMSLNSGLGDVVEKNKVILNSQLHTGLQAVRHSDGNKWWVITFSKTGNNFYKTLLSPNDIITTDSQAIGDELNISGIGQMSFSPNGEKFAHFDHNNQLLLFDFNRSSGELSNYQHLVVDTPFYFPNGLSFSPSGRFLYVSSYEKVYQLDLEASDILGSKVLVGEYDGLVPDTYFERMQLGPDCKIYITPHGPVPFLHVINHPDEPGLACGFVQRGIDLPCSANYSIPNFPHYRLGTGYPVCDSSIVYVSSGYVPPPEEEAVRVWPNPATEELNMEVDIPVDKHAKLWLFNAVGQVVKRWPVSAGRQSFSLQGLGEGLYYWKLEGDGIGLGSGKLIISR